MDGYVGFVPDPSDLRSFAEGRRNLTHSAANIAAFKPLRFGGFLYLHPKPDHPLTRILGGFAIGSRVLRDVVEQARDAGVSHVALNPRVTPRPYVEILDELGSIVLLAFPLNDSTAGVHNVVAI